jgi:flagellar protein FlgJ
MMGAAAAAGAPGQTSYFIARVKFVLLDDSDLPKFNRLGGWKAIGSIECLPFINFNDPKTEPIIARPLRSNYTQYPLVNEAVLVKILISKEAQDNVGNYKPEFYYTDIISVWNAPEHNVVPDKSYFLLNPNDKTGTGKFIQTGETKRLVKAPGDVTLEGRRGGSIRLGSNTPGFRTPWTAATSKPIFIISNNPVKVDGPARFEDVNKDGSIMMMMSGHNPGFVPASANFDSYDTVVNIGEKQNFVVTDQKPQSEPTAALVQQDAKPIPADVPVTGSIPVSNPVPPPVKSDTMVDEEELPEREDLQEIDVQVEEFIVLPATIVDNSNTPVSPIDAKLKIGQKNVLKTTATNKGALYVSTYYEAAKKAGDLYNLDPIIILAQGSFESDWGGSNIVKMSNNFFGITAGGKVNNFWKGEIYQSKGGNKLKFRSYSSPEMSFKDFARLISSKYKDAYGVSYDYKQYAQKIAYSPYISESNGDNRESYRKAVISRYEKIKSLLK